MAKTGPKPLSLSVLLWRRVDKSSGPDGCWLWQGATIKGYGVVGGRRGDYTHRVAWMVTFGEIPNGLQVLHDCDLRNEPRTKSFAKIARELGVSASVIQDVISRRTWKHVA